VGRIDRLVERYRNHLAVPWAKALSGGERSIFVVYDRADERKLRARKDHFAIATRDAGHEWRECDLTRAFAEWMAAEDYRESYFEAPEDLTIKLESEFLPAVAARIRDVLAADDVDDETVLAVFGVASLFGFVRVSDVLKRVEADIRGRMVVFFPGEYENHIYRLLDARDGWNYQAAPITLHNGVFDL